MRFRLRSIFVLTFAVAVGCMVFFTLPDLLSLLVLAAVAMATPGALIAGIIYGRGAKRAFAIGSLASGGWALWSTPLVVYMFVDGSVTFADATEVKMGFAIFYGALIFAGLVSVGVRRLCYQGKNGIRPPRDCC